MLYFASAIKALLPVLPEIATDPSALLVYECILSQNTISETRIFRCVHLPLKATGGHSLTDLIVG